MTRRAWLGCAGLLVMAATSGCGPSSDLPPGVAERLASPAARRDGRRLFLEHCALCHGEHADGRGPRRSAFARPPRDFTDTAWRRTATPAQVLRAIREGVPGTAMPAWELLGDRALVDLTAYVLSVAGR